MTLSTEQVIQIASERERERKRERTQAIKSVIRSFIAVSTTGYRCSRHTRRLYYRGFINGYDSGYFRGSFAQLVRGHDA
jgi:hypothetical protein